MITPPQGELALIFENCYVIVARRRTRTGETQLGYRSAAATGHRGVAPNERLFSVPSEGLHAAFDTNKAIATTRIPCARSA
jgi:hypothetical protein